MRSSVAMTLTPRPAPRIAAPPTAVQRRPDAVHAEAVDAVRRAGLVAGRVELHDRRVLRLRRGQRNQQHAAEHCGQQLGL